MVGTDTSQIQRGLSRVRRCKTPGWPWPSARLGRREGIGRGVARGAARLVGGDGLQDFVRGGRMVERPKRREGLARGHLLGRAFRAPLSRAAVAVPKTDLGRVLAPMARARGADDFILRRGQKALLGDFLQAALVVVIG